MTRRPALSVGMSASPRRGVVDEASGPRQPPRVPSDALLGERGELIIVHAGREYRLRRTSLGKLILTA